MTSAPLMIDRGIHWHEHYWPSFPLIVIQLLHAPFQIWEWRSTQKLHCLWSERGCIHAIKKHNNCVTFFQRRSGSLELLEDIGECLHALLESFCRLLAEINELSHSYCMGIYATRANFSRIICQMAKRSLSEIAVLLFGCARILSLALVERADKM